MENAFLQIFNQDARWNKMCIKIRKEKLYVYPEDII